ncbi:MAG TPA: hypothetical protein VN176_10445 [Verrucomicrobiae bacterium]|jgi:hypothetical protein|nr:hypothetical protein [Verrucomicrobiae bacterium]
MSRKRQAELVMGAISYVFMGLFVFSVTTGLFFGTIVALRADKPVVLEFMLWGVFLFWQLVPILFEGYSPGLNFREVARYPVSLRLYLLLNAAYGLFDPAALSGLLWLASIWLGILFARPGWALPAAALFLVFVALNLLCNRMVIGIFERFQSTRRGRERMVAVLLLFMLVPQMFNFIANGWINVHRFHLPHWVFDAVAVVRSISPPRLVLQSLDPGETQSLLPLALLLAYALLAAVLQFRQLRAVYQGEIYAESFKVQRELKVKPGWQLPGLSPAVSAILEKELRYIRQNSRLLVALAYPLVLFGFLLLGGPGKKMFSLSNGGNLLGAFAGFLALSVSNISYNTFGMDGEGFGRWLLSPLPLQKIMRAKNLAHGALMFTIYLVGTAAVLAVGHVPPDKLVAVTAGFLSLLTINLGAGNVMSVYWPKRIDFTKMTTRMTSSASGFAALLVLAPMAGVSGIVVFATWYWKLSWLPLVAGLAGLALSLKIYSWLLNWAVRHAGEHLEEISSELGV